MAWGGQKEQASEYAAGNLNAKNWHDEALHVVEKTMQAYWQDRSVATTTPSSATALSTSLDNVTESEFDRHRRTLHAQALNDEGWATELRQYLKDISDDVTKEINVIEWWSVSAPEFYIGYLLIHLSRDILRCIPPFPG
jgi:hypothetical protein